MFHFFEDLLNYFPKWLYHVTFPSAKCGYFNFSTSGSSLIFVHQVVFNTKPVP